MKQLLVATTLTLSIALSGCSAITDEVISVEMSLRNQILAQKAWGHWSWCYGDIDCPFHFARGFKAGYGDILDGGSGCQPTLPPQCYWKPDFQTPDGHCMINGWFDGFSHGALAAKQDGYGAMNEIPISPTARANFETARRADQAQFIHGGAMPVPGIGPGILPGEGAGGIIGLPQPEGGFALPQLPENAGEGTAPPVRPYE